MTAIQEKWLDAYTGGIMKLREVVEEFLPRHEVVLGDLNEAIETADLDSQRTVLAALVGLNEMLRSAALHSDDDPE